MLKNLLSALSLVSMLVLVQAQKPVLAADAFCVIRGESDEILFQNNCIFEQHGGNGSFSIQAPSGLIAGNLSISVSILKPGTAEVRGLTTNGINSRWGEARRSTSDAACWIGSDFTICAY